MVAGTEFFYSCLIAHPNDEICKRFSWASTERRRPASVSILIPPSGRLLSQTLARSTFVHRSISLWLHHNTLHIYTVTAINSETRHTNSAGQMLPRSSISINRITVQQTTTHRFRIIPSSFVLPLLLYTTQWDSLQLIFSTASKGKRHHHNLPSVISRIHPKLSRAC